MKHFFSAALILFMFSCASREIRYQAVPEEMPWQGKGKSAINPDDTLVMYGHELIANTSHYLGPKGRVNAISNGMNCQNCHLDGGTVPFGNNYSAVVSTYPKYRPRSGGLETIPKRVNDCFERSLNGKALDTNSREMKAILAYLHWLGDDVPPGTNPTGSGIMNLVYMNRPANPAKGQIIYQQQCVVCHGNNGDGQPNIDSSGYLYPPLWGRNSYNSGAGLFRISRLAGYIKANMPFGKVTYKTPLLSDEDAWDVAAYINSQPRPGMDISRDWPDISKKPMDHPFGPYSDTLSEQQHKYGPWKKIR